MNRTWLSYVVLAVGMLLLVVSDKHSNADDKQTAHTMSFGTEQEMEIFVNKSGDTDTQVKLVIDGKSYEFSMPEIADGQEKVITTADGKEVTIKSVSGNKMIWIDGNEMQLPGFGKHKMSAEGLSAMIGRTHQMKLSDGVSISGQGLSDDVKAAIVDAVKGVLISYNIDKKVTISNNNFALHVIGEDGDANEMGKYEFKIKTESSDDQHVMVIHKEIEVVEDKN